MLDMAAVEIDVPPGTAEDLRGAIIAGCTGALGDGQCKLKDAEPRRSAVWYAVVFDEGESDDPRLTVELWYSPEGPRVGVREVRFSDADSVEQRWTSLGTVLAAMVAVRQLGRPPPMPSPVVEEREPDPPPPEPEPPPPPPELDRFRVAAGASVGKARAGGSPRVGPLLRLSQEFLDRRLHITGALGFSQEVISEESQLSFASASLGFGTRLEVMPSVLAVEFRGELSAQRLFITVPTPIAKQTETEQLNRVGGHLGLDLNWQLSEGLDLVTGAELALLRPEVGIQIGEREIGNILPLGWNAVVVLQHAY